MVVVSLAYLFRYQMGGPDVYLMNGQIFYTDELNAMEAAFGKEGLKGWDFDGPKIRIPRGQQGRFLAASGEEQCVARPIGRLYRKRPRKTPTS